MPNRYRTVERAVAIKRIDAVRKVVLGEVMIPAPDMQAGDAVRMEDLEGLIHFDGAFMVAPEIRALADRFAIKSPSIDVEHDGVPIGATPVETFIARAGDPDFRAGSWVVGVMVHDEAVWKQVEALALRAFSIQFIVRVEEVPVMATEGDSTTPSEIKLWRFSNGDPQFLSLVRNPATGAEWHSVGRAAVPFQGLPLAPLEVDWNPAEARARVAAWAGDDTLKARAAFATWSPDGTGLQIADVVDGHLMVVRQAVIGEAATAETAEGSDLQPVQHQRTLRHLLEYAQRAEADEPEPITATIDRDDDDAEPDTVTLDPADIGDDVTITEVDADGDADTDAADVAEAQRSIDQASEAVSAGVAVIEAHADALEADPNTDHRGLGRRVFDAVKRTLGLADAGDADADEDAAPDNAQDVPPAGADADPGHAVACSTGRGAKLTAALESAIESKVTDDRTRSDVISSMATAAGISESTVGQILRGEINCPPLARLSGFASALGVSAGSLQTAAEGDGCSYGADEEERGVMRAHLTFGGTMAADAVNDALWDGFWALQSTLRTIYDSGETNQLGLASAAISDFSTWATGLLTSIAAPTAAMSFLGLSAENYARVAGLADLEEGLILAEVDPDAIARAGAKMAKARLEKLQGIHAALAALLDELVQQVEVEVEEEESRSEPEPDADADPDTDADTDTDADPDPADVARSAEVTRLREDLAKSQARARRLVIARSAPSSGGEPPPAAPPEPPSSLELVRSAMFTTSSAS